jgi:hypothetical protein
MDPRASLDAMEKGIHTHRIPASSLVTIRNESIDMFLREVTVKWIRLTQGRAVCVDMVHCCQCLGKRGSEGRPDVRWERFVETPLHLSGQSVMAETNRLICKILALGHDCSCYVGSVRFPSPSVMLWWHVRESRPLLYGNGTDPVNARECASRSKFSLWELQINFFPFKFCKRNSDICLGLLLHVMKLPCVRNCYSLT